MSTHLAQQATAEILARVEQVSGHPVILVRDTTLTTLATVKPATPQQPSHIVRYRDDPAPAAYQIAFECGFLLRLFALPPAERVQLIGTAAARQTVARNLRQLRADLGSPTVEHVTDLIYDGLMLQLRSCGPGIEVDSRLFAQYPALRELQAATMTQQAQTNAATLNPDLDRQFPPFRGPGQPGHEQRLCPVRRRVARSPPSRRALPVRGPGTRGAGAACRPLH